MRTFGRWVLAASGGQIEELRSEKRGGETIYEGEVVSNGKGTELQVSEDVGEGPSPSQPS